jgi:hypothetical protein
MIHSSRPLNNKLPHACPTYTYTRNTPVNEEQSLHQEVDPRYRGSHIPSRAFRMLQNFTASDSSAADDGKPYITNTTAFKILTGHT